MAIDPTLRRWAVSLLGLGVSVAWATTLLAQDGPAVEAGRVVTLEYTITLDDGSTAATNVGAEPLVFTQGEHKILPAVEAGLVGMHASDSRKFSIAPEDAYGHVDENAFVDVDVELIPADSRTVGAVLLAQDPAGNARRVRVHDVSEDKIVVDYNHPLAGEALHLDVRIIAVE